MQNLPVARPWIRTLAAPYLRGYRAARERRGSLRGYWFLHPKSVATTESHRAKTAIPTFEAAAGFFVGYLIAEDGFQSLSPAPPECLVFAFAAPVGSELHRSLVAEKGSLLRRTFDYIRLLTHRPPRFVFQEKEFAALVRHLAMRDWPRPKCDHLSRNFFIETLAWLVRSALVRKILAEEVRVANALRSGPEKFTRRAARATAF